MIELPGGEPGRVDVFRSRSRGPCEERALVLQAIGIASQLAFDGEGWRVLVAATEQTTARVELARYERENPPRPPPTPPRAPQPHAWAGSLVYALVVLATAYLAGIDAFGYDWLDSGALRAGLVRAGESWRAVTALTLHLDVAHLIANLGFGTVFGYLAGQLLGPGVAWLTIAAAATVANLANALVAPVGHSSVGASTAVFATLGLLAAHGWRQRHLTQERWARRLAPLVAGVALLAFLGVGGERTDVLAHLTGFVIGALAGWWHGNPARDPPRGHRAQAACGAAAVALVVIAWWAALSAAG